MALSDLGVLFVAIAVSAVVSQRLVMTGPATRSRDLHAEPVSRIGGVAVGLGFLAAMCTAWALGRGALVSRASEVWLLCGGGILALGVGLLDDRLELGPYTKLTLQALVAAPVVAVWPVEHAIPALWAGLWVVVVINAINLIDGLDELAAGVVAIAAGTLVLVGAVDHRGLLRITALALLGATFGFWRLNRAPARLFLGDSGGHFAGYVLAVISLLVPSKTLTALTLGPVLLLGLPLLELVTSAVRRVAAGRSPLQADLGHLHHRLIATGWTERQAVRLLHGLALAGSGASLWLVGTSPRGGPILALLGLCVSASVLIHRPDDSPLRRELQQWVDEGRVNGAVARGPEVAGRILIVGTPVELTTLPVGLDGIHVAVDGTAPSDFAPLSARLRETLSASA